MPGYLHGVIANEPEAVCALCLPWMRQIATDGTIWGTVEGSAAARDEETTISAVRGSAAGLSKDATAGKVPTTGTVEGSSANTTELMPDRL